MSLKVTKGRKSRYKGQNRSYFDLNRKRQIIHKKEALKVMFSKMIIKVKQDHLRSKILDKGQKVSNLVCYLN